MNAARLEVHNATQQPRIVWVEPLGEDFTLLAAESLEIVAGSDSKQQWFGVVESEGGTQVYLQEPSFTDFQVIQKGARIECGHNREAGLKAGLKY